MSSKNWLGVIRNLKDRVEESPTASRLASGPFWSLTASVLARGLSLLSAIVVARILGTHDVGQLGMIHSTVGMFGVLAGFGMGMTARNTWPSSADKTQLVPGASSAYPVSFPGSREAP